VRELLKKGWDSLQRMKKVKLWYYEKKGVGSGGDSVPGLLSRKSLGEWDEIEEFLRDG